MASRPRSVVAFRAAAGLLAAAAACAGVSAATMMIEVADADGKPLPDAAALLEPLGCNIHDNMAAWVIVADTPWFARSADDGRARIDSVPPGSYRLRLRHPAFGANVEPAASALTVGATDLAQAAKLTVSEQP